MDEMKIKSGGVIWDETVIWRTRSRNEDGGSDDMGIVDVRMGSNVDGVVDACHHGAETLHDEFCEGGTSVSIFKLKAERLLQIRNIIT